MEDNRPPRIGRWASPRSHVVIVHALLATVSSAESVGPHVGAYPTAQASLRGMTLPSRFAALVRSSETAPAPPHERIYHQLAYDYGLRSAVI